MFAAVCDGDARKLSELIGQDPGFNVNMGQDEFGRTLLHFACLESGRSAVIPFLLAHPAIDVNLKSRNESTPFNYACRDGFASCVREMLKDSRVKVNEPRNDGFSPLWAPAVYGRLDVIRWWIASGREMDLGKPGDVGKTDAIGAARNNRKTDVVALLERFKSDASQTRHAMRVELGWHYSAAAEMFALVIFVSDGLLEVKNLVDSTTPAARFFRIVSRLPLELQMVFCFRQVGLAKEIIPGKDSEVAFKELARRLW